MKFSLDWLNEFVDSAAAGGAEGVRALLDQAGFPVESTQLAGSDTVLDVEITPNRPDAMGHRGLAREVAAMAGLPMRDLEPRYADPESRGESAEHLASIVIRVPKLCRRFGARIVRGIGSAPATAGMRRSLSAIGAKSISAAVDATNYALWDTGQPLHAFDLDRLAGGLLIVRRAAHGEKLVTLDGVERVLEPSDVVVADAERAVSLAGIMGGLDTAVTAETKNVLLEAAWWDPVSIRKTARRLGMHTDASHRFERGADYGAIPGALNLAARLLVESAGGAVATGLLDAHGSAFRLRRTFLRLARLRLLSGDPSLSLDFAEEALARLGFTAERRGKRVAVRIPYFRADVRREDDLVEEVLRVYGYNRLPTRLPPATAPGEFREPLRAVEDRLSDGAAAAGFFETIQYPFVDRDTDEAAWGEWLRDHRDGARAAGDPQSPGRHAPAPAGDAAARPARRARAQHPARRRGGGGVRDRPRVRRAGRAGPARVLRVAPLRLRPGRRGPRALERAGEAAGRGLLRRQGPRRAAARAVAARRRRCAGSRSRSRG